MARKLEADTATDMVRMAISQWSMAGWSADQIKRRLNALVREYVDDLERTATS